MSHLVYEFGHGNRSDTGTSAMYFVGLGWKVGRRVEISVTQLFIDIEHFDMNTSSVGINWIF